MTDEQAAHAPDTTYAAVFDGVRSTLQPVLAEIGGQAQVLYEQLGGAEVIAALEAAIVERDRAAAEWEAEHPGVRYGEHCHCWCRLRGHVGLCQGQALTVEHRTLYGDVVAVPVCAACAAANRTGAPAGASR